MNEKNPLLKYHNQFKQLETKCKEWPVIAFDTEDDTKGRATLFGFYGDFPDKEFVTRHADEAQEFIYSITEPTIFVAHNLEYDIANLCKHDNYIMVENMMYASRLLRVDFAGVNHVFLNSLSFFAGSLAQMAAFVGLEKLDGDAYNEKYVIRDAEIAYTFVKKFQKKLVNEMRINLGVSIGKMSMDTYRAHHMQNKVQVTYNSPNCLNAYYGGRVEIFKKGISKNIQVVDINSSYPNVMRNYPYPDTSLIEPASIYTHEYGIGLFTVFVPDSCFIPVLPYKSPEGRLFFPKGEFTGWWCYSEVRYALEHGTVIIKEHSGEGTNCACFPFVDFIDTYYEKRQECKVRIAAAKKTGVPDPEAKFDDLYFKLWLNNLYGKFTQHKAGSSMSRDKWPEYKIEKYLENPEFKEMKIGPFFGYSVPKDEPPVTANFMWGIYVTAYARINLHKGMMAAHNAGHVLLYCDTDSVMYEKTNDTLPFAISNNLGDWDIETFDLGLFMQAKGYLLCNKSESEKNTYDIIKVACKGVPTHYAYDFIIDGMARFQKPLRLKEALIRTHAVKNKNKSDAFLMEIGANVWNDVEKEMRSIYIKRLGDTVTYPVNAADIEHIENNSAELISKSAQELLKEAKTVINKPKAKKRFTVLPIPKNWFANKNSHTAKDTIEYHAHKTFALRTEQLLDVKPSQTWFAGHVIGTYKTKNGKEHYKIFTEFYKGKKLPFILWCSIPVKFLKKFGVYEKLDKKYLEIILKDSYLLKSEPNLSITIKTAEKSKTFDAKFLDDDNEELTEDELKKLMNMNRSTFYVSR